MVALPPVANVARVVLNTNYASEPCANVLHYKQIAANGNYDLNALAEAIAQKWIANIAPLVPETVELGSVIATDLDPTPQAPGQNTTGSGTSGGVTTPQLPNNVTACMTLRTAVGGRSGRGRLYHVGIAENNVIMNVLDPGFVGQLVTGWNTFINVADTLGDQWKWSIVSFFSNNAVRATPMVNAITAISCDSTVDSMRRRIPGH